MLHMYTIDLLIVNVCKIPLIQNMMGILLEICIFFKYSAKRQGLLEKNITQICARHDYLRVFSELYKQYFKQS